MQTPSQDERIRGEVRRIYGHRFPPEMRARRRAVWAVLYRHWLSRYVPERARVLEIGAGYCELLDQVEAERRVAVDLNPETRSHAAEGIEVLPVPADQLADSLPAGHFDVAFASNFLEHCRTRSELLDVLSAAHQVLRPGGRLVVLGPNFAHCYRRYFDFIDHHLALTELAVAEALELVGFELDEVRARTLPFTFRSRLPSWPWVVRLYLALPWAWRWFGAQYLVVGRRPGS